MPTKVIVEYASYCQVSSWGRVDRPSLDLSDTFDTHILPLSFTTQILSVKLCGFDVC